MTETKHEKFLRLSAARLEKAQFHIGLISNLAAPNYEFSSAEVEQIIVTLKSSLSKVAGAFNHTAPEPVIAPVKISTDRSLNEGDVRWALDMLAFGKIDDAKHLLKRSIQGLDR